MKTRTIAALAAVSLFPALGFAQSTPAVPRVPPVPPVPAIAPVPPPGDDDGDRAPKVPVTFLGVETSDVPSVVAEQLGLAKGFGLVDDYVVPNSPAAAAGVQANDILKMLNDQILTEPNQLAKLIRSFNEGTSVTLTVLRKGTETKLTAKLAKKEVPQRRGMRHWHDGRGFGGLGPEFNESMKQLGEELGNMDFSMFDPSAMNEVREQARDAQRGVREATREAARAARDAAREFRVSRQDNGALKTTHIDMNRAQIVYHDTQGELKLENVSGKKVLTAKDPEGRLVFSGPVDTKEEMDKLPPDVRQRYDKLEQKDLPAIAPSVKSDGRESEANEDDNDNDGDDNDGDGASVLQVSCPAAAPVNATAFDLNIVLI